MAEVFMRDGAGLHVTVSGPVDAPALVLGPKLGTSLELWDDLVAQVPDGLRVIRYDLRGHGLSDVTAGPYSMGQLIGDAETICEAYSIADAVFLGAAEGGLIALGLAVKRPDLVRALILSGAAPKIDHPQAWHAQAETVETRGMAQVTDTSLNRMFGKDFYGSLAMAKWVNMMMTTEPEGYAAACRAFAGADMITPMSGLRIPTLGIAGTEDQKVPPDMVKEGVDLVPGSQFQLMKGIGHLPALEAPEEFAQIILQFLGDIGHFPDPDQAAAAQSG
ncbi:MAG: alpha/beta fold hydrolase [Pseudomonadota bacterium]